MELPRIQFIKDEGQAKQRTINSINTEWKQAFNHITWETALNSPWKVAKEKADEENASHTEPVPAQIHKQAF